MKDFRTMRNALAAGLAMAVLILDSAAAFEGASEGVSICIQTVIPSLFPFFILSSMLTGNLYGRPLRIFRPIGRFLRLPNGMESIWLTGLLGGYPTGARCVSQAYQSKFISKNEAQRMLGFCSNAGPAFIFGMTAHIFPTMLYPCGLFMIQILSSMLTAVVIPSEISSRSTPCKTATVSWNQAMQDALRAMGCVCGWIIAFRVILIFFERWFFFYFPNAIRIILTGLIELSNGVLYLQRMESLPWKFITCSAMLSFGGLCVAMQTQAVTEGLSMGSYLNGKLLQCAISTGIASLSCCFLFTFSKIYVTISIICSVFIFLICLFTRKKTVALSKFLMYNARKKIHAR